MDRQVFTEPFTDSSPPLLQCPQCTQRTLQLNTASIVKRETSESRLSRNEDAFEPEWIREVFTCIFECANAQCKEPVMCVGTAQLVSEDSEDAN
jgi:hypothetical protein